MYEIHSKHYITVDDENRITAGWSQALQPDWDTTDAICINENGSYQFRLFPGGEENPRLYDRKHMIPLYKYERGEVAKRSEEEVDADMAAVPEPEEAISQIDQMEAQITYTAMMTDTLLEV